MKSTLTCPWCKGTGWVSAVYRTMAVAFGDPVSGLPTGLPPSPRIECGACQGRGKIRAKMMLFNHTEIPDDILLPLLRACAKYTGAKTTQLPVVITHERGGPNGAFYPATRLHHAYCNPEKPTDHSLRIDGMIHIKMLHPSIIRYIRDKIWDISLTTAKSILHEFAHAQDYQCLPIRFTSPQYARDDIPWENRPVEMYADAVEKGADLHGFYETISDDILNLGIWYEEQIDKNNKPARLSD